MKQYRLKRNTTVYTPSRSKYFQLDAGTAITLIRRVRSVINEYWSIKTQSGQKLGMLAPWPDQIDEIP